MLPKFLTFWKKSSKIKSGDVVIVKRSFISRYPDITSNSILTVEKVEDDKAIVVFMNDKGNKIYRESLPMEAIVKTG